MRKRITVVMVLVVSLMAVGLSGSAKPTRTEVPAAGTQFVCGDAVFTSTAGQSNSRSMNGGNKTSVTIKFRHVVGANE